jgi:hypothetical protein
MPAKLWLLVLGSFYLNCFAPDEETASGHIRAVAPVSAKEHKRNAKLIIFPKHRIIIFSITFLFCKFAYDSTRKRHSRLILIFGAESLDALLRRIPLYDHRQNLMDNNPCETFHIFRGHQVYFLP